MKGAETMKITPPPRDFYTDRELAEHWEIEQNLVIRYIETGKLNAVPKKKTRMLGGGINWVTQKPSKCKEQILATWYEIPLAEVERFEAEHPPTPAAPEPAKIEFESQKMTDADIKDYVTQQRLDGVADKAIILELLQRKTVTGKDVSKQKIGKAMHPNPDMVTDSAFTHYVTKLLNKG